MTKISNTLRDIISKAPQIGDRKIGKDGIEREYQEIRPGKTDWRRVSSGSSSKTKKSSKKTDSADTGNKLLATLKKTDSSKLRSFANKPNNAPKLRQAAYDELVDRGEDVSDIDLNTGRYGKLKSAFGVGSKKSDFHFDGDGDGGDDEEEEDIDWKDPDFIKKEFGNLRTKKQRIDYDAFVTEQKKNDKYYLAPDKEIYELNKMYAGFIESDAPLMLSTGGAGVGKTYNFHLIAESLGKRPFDPTKDQPGDKDYDYVEAPEVTPAQLIPLLQEHNGKIILFDDSDGILKDTGALNILKKATATSGKRMIGRQTSSDATSVPPFEFTGKIIFLSNMSQATLTKNEDMRAIYSRAIKKDIYFTKEEQLFFIDKLKHKFNFTGVDRLENKADDIQEREDVFEILKTHYKDIDPAKFNSRIMMEALAKKRDQDAANERIKNDPIQKLMYGDETDWKYEVERMLMKDSGYTTKEQRLEKARETLKLND